MSALRMVVAIAVLALAAVAAVPAAAPAEADLCEPAVMVAAASTAPSTSATCSDGDGSSGGTTITQAGSLAVATDGASTVVDIVTDFTTTASLLTTEVRFASYGGLIQIAWLEDVVTVLDDGVVVAQLTALTAPAPMRAKALLVHKVDATSSNACTGVTRWEAWFADVRPGEADPAPASALRVNVTYYEDSGGALSKAKWRPETHSTDNPEALPGSETWPLGPDQWMIDAYHVEHRLFDDSELLEERFSTVTRATTGCR